MITIDNPCVYPSCQFVGLLQHSMLAIVQQVLLLSVWVGAVGLGPWDPGTLSVTAISC